MIQFGQRFFEIPFERRLVLGELVGWTFPEDEKKRAKRRKTIRVIGAEENVVEVDFVGTQWINNLIGEKIEPNDSLQ